MIPYLDSKAQLPELYIEFLEALAAAGFEGDIETDYASRLVVATDNSIYQLVPLAVVFPAGEDDVSKLLALAHRERFARPSGKTPIKLSPRGGGTGTNGQSLCDGVIVDLSRYLSDILETNLEQGFVRVQPGVVLDELNAHLKPHGVFFAPNLSPSNRATIGGMIATDASGKGSRVYGKTSEHVLSLRAVLIDGSVLDAKPIGSAALAAMKARKDLTGSIFRTVDDVVTTNAELIRDTLPKIKRFVTGYDLAHAYRHGDGTFDITTVLCGSEGTLAFVTEAKLKLTKLPAHRQLLAIRYSDFDSALRAANMLVQSNPGAIETIDETIVGLAKNDVIWQSVGHLVRQEDGEPPLAAINLVEFESDDPAVVEQKVTELTEQLRRNGGSSTSIGWTLVKDPKDIAALWTLRKKGVGLLGNLAGDRRPIPFVEDTAVPPEKLADYIRDFRKILDRHGLRYGMFGHIDVGCLHVRPALDMRSDDDEKLLRSISDEVAALTKSYGGVLWGEHGKGVRGEYTPLFFGPELYEQLRRIKGAFDPENQLNPGKLATPVRNARAQLISIDTVKRGKLDREIHPVVRDKFDTAVHCNGNGACFDWSPDSVMCPSSKVTRDRIHSPKGRAGIMREWLRLLAREGHDAGVSRNGNGNNGSSEGGALSSAIFRSRESAPKDFSHEVYDAMSGCLACKACATQCPIKVDVPAFRSDFLAQYHQRYRRPVKDYFVGALEWGLSLMASFPRRLINGWMKSAFATKLLANVVGIVDTPLLAESSLESGLKERKAEPFDRQALDALSTKEKARTVLIAQDAFTTFYEPNVALAAFDVLTTLGFRVVFLPYLENGKGLHIKGFLDRFNRVATRNASMLSDVAKLEIPIVGLEPAVVLTYRDEYVHALGKDAVPFEVHLLQEFLVQKLSLIEKTAGVGATRKEKLRLFGHCTERTAAPKSQAQWRRVFEALGMDLEIAVTGCCGMCGVFGHEAEHLEESRGVFEMSWATKLANKKERKTAIVTGHSCRSQVKRFAPDGGFLARHPIEAIRDHLVDVSEEQRRGRENKPLNVDGGASTGRKQAQKSPDATV
jgi:FAD/FMN-containing dehydrogenase/Fe-S oxidoreductase